MKTAKTNPGPAPAGPLSTEDLSPRAIALRHLRFGWWSLLVFLTLGIVLEGLHGFKVGSYLAPSSHTRRLMWTLAHAHGTLLSLVHLAFASTLSQIAPKLLPPVSIGLISSSILIPGGFFLGGVFIYGGDPGIGILLVPLGAALLLGSVFLIAKSTLKSGTRG